MRKLEISIEIISQKWDLRRTSDWFRRFWARDCPRHLIWTDANGNPINKTKKLSFFYIGIQYAWEVKRLYQSKTNLCTVFLGNLPNLPNSVVCDFTWSQVIHITFMVVATSFRMYLSLFSLPKTIRGWEGTEWEGLSQAIFSIHLWKKFKIYWVVFVYPRSLSSNFSWTNGPQTKWSGLLQSHVLI
jgi:hypothetical protein